MVQRVFLFCWYGILQSLRFNVGLLKNVEYLLSLFNGVLVGIIYNGQVFVGKIIVFYGIGVGDGQGLKWFEGRVNKGIVGVIVGQY